MKSAIVLAEGIRQVMLVAETPAEKNILKVLGEPGQEMYVEFTQGSFYDSRMPESALGFRVQECMGGSLRAYHTSVSEDGDGLMIVLRPKKETSNGD